MKKTLTCLSFILILCVFTPAQSTATQTQDLQSSESKTKKPIFRSTKDQILQAQKILKLPETGKMSDEDRAALKTYQTGNGLKANGSLNRATLEKMGIPLTEKQKLIPVSPNSYAPSDSAAKKRGPVFRANKDQVTQAQKIIRVTESGKLDETTREALKTYQTEKGLKVTGTLNKVTLEKMRIELTDKQKAM